MKERESETQRREREREREHSNNNREKCAYLAHNTLWAGAAGLIPSIARPFILSSSSSAKKKN
jgi:hypothetical protein